MIINCKEVELKILNELDEDTTKLKANGIEPALAIVRVLGDSASGNYVNRKQAACSKHGIKSIYVEHPEDVKEEDVAESIRALNEDPNVHGIILQLPIPKHLNEHYLINLIDPRKDVDCLTKVNVGKLFMGEDVAAPCTPSGIVQVFKHYNIDLCGKDVLVINRSMLVGKPLVELLQRENATVTLAHSRTKDLEYKMLNADIIITAVGKKDFISYNTLMKLDKFKDNKKTYIADVSINSLGDGKKICGDVELNSTAGREHLAELENVFITPVPTGIGTTTVACLLQNTIKVCKEQNKRALE